MQRGRILTCIGAGKAMGWMNSVHSKGSWNGCKRRKHSEYIKLLRKCIRPKCEESVAWTSLIRCCEHFYYQTAWQRSTQKTLTSEENLELEQAGVVGDGGGWVVGVPDDVLEVPETDQLYHKCLVFGHFFNWSIICTNNDGTITFPLERTWSPPHSQSCSAWFLRQQCAWWRAPGESGFQFVNFDLNLTIING